MHELNSLASDLHRGFRDRHLQTLHPASPCVHTEVRVSHGQSVTEEAVAQRGPDTCTRSQSSGEIQTRTWVKSRLRYHCCLGA